jgi:hypothetical protein
MSANQIPEHNPSAGQTPADVDDTDALIASAIKHMNDDHAHNLLDYAQILAGRVWAEHAQMISLDRDGFDLSITGGETSERVRIGFDTPWADVHQLRKVMAQLAHRARALRQSGDG